MMLVIYVITQVQQDLCIRTARFGARLVSATEAFQTRQCIMVEAVSIQRAQQSITQGFSTKLGVPMM